MKYGCCPRILLLTASALSASAAEDPHLDDVLGRLSRVATLYVDHALSFTCDETITSTAYPPSVHHFDYIYGYSDIDGKLVDYRTPRGRAAERSAEHQERVRLEHYGLPVYLLRAYSWVFMFREANQRLHRFELVGRDEVLGRPAIGVRFAALPPFVEGVNEWCGTAWIDARTSQLLAVDAVRADECEDHARIERWRKGADAPSALVRRDVTDFRTEFDVVKNGMRFPGRVLIRRTAIQAGPGGLRNFHEVPIFRIRQTYKRYRFFHVRTQDEIERIIAGSPALSPS